MVCYRDKPRKSQALGGYARWNGEREYHLARRGLAGKNMVRHRMNQRMGLCLDFGERTGRQADSTRYLYNVLI